MKLTQDWQRYAVSGKLEARPGQLYTVNFYAKDLKATMWLDAVQLQRGELSDYEAASDVEVGLVSEAVGQIFHVGKPATVTLLAAQTKPARRTIEPAYRIIDFWGKQVAAGRCPVKLSDRAGEVKLPLFTDRSGLFRIDLSLGGRQSQMVYSVLPPNPYPNSLHPHSTLGTDALFDEDHLAILKRANFNWVITKMLGRWYNVEKEPDVFTYDDAAIAAAKRHHLHVVIQLMNLDWGRPGLDQAPHATPQQTVAGQPKATMAQALA